MIEKDLQIIRKTQKVSRTKTAQELKSLAKRQTVHERQLKNIVTSISLLPTQDIITKTIQDTIKIVVNGKIDALSNKVDLVGEHLKRQDATAEEQGNSITDLRNEVKPITMARVFSADLIKLVKWLGAVCAALTAILYFLYRIGLLK